MKRQIESLWAPSLQGRMSIDMVPFSYDGCSSKRTFITLDGQRLWDFPNDFYNRYVRSYTGSGSLKVIPPKRGEGVDRYPWGVMGDETEEVIRWYLDTPIPQLFEPMTYEHRNFLRTKPIIIDIDKWDLGDILRAADRRIGYQRLMWWMFFEMDGGNPAKKVLGARFRDKKK